MFAEYPLYSSAFGWSVFRIAVLSIVILCLLNAPKYFPYLLADPGSRSKRRGKIIYLVVQYHLVRDWRFRAIPNLS